MELKKIQKILQEDCVLRIESPLLVGVSGGADSLCLLDVLHSLGYALIVAHFDHGLRPESAADAEQVRGEAKARGLPFVTARQDVAALARAESFSIEEAARVARYGFLYEQARQHRAQGIAVAHTADDQVETVLMHLLRGGGIGRVERNDIPDCPSRMGYGDSLAAAFVGRMAQRDRIVVCRTCIAHFA